MEFIAKNTVDNSPQTIEIIKCPCCGVSLTNLPKQTYISYSKLWSHYGRLLICKKCVEDLWNEFLVQYNYDTEKAMYYLCLTFDYAFHKKLVESSKKATEGKDISIVSRYLTTLNSFGKKSDNRNGYADCFKNGEKLDYEKFEEESKIVKKKKIILSDEDKKNEADILQIFGYDPFENENPLNKKYLYNRLVDSLDEATLEDNFKLPIVIEIVKSFNQIEKINTTLANMDTKQMAEKISDIKNLMQAKTSMLTSILAMAKDNGISVNHSNNKSKGAGTLSGIIKNLKELDLNEIGVNLFNLETSEAMKQIADISNQSIMDQLHFDENDYAEMIKDQVKIIKDLNDKVVKIEEENRILKFNKMVGGE